jgi:hypothetical protein
MTVAEAERALKAKLAPVSLPYSKECYVTRRADGKDEALSYVAENSKIAVVTVWLPDDRQPNPNIVDANGIGVGSTESSSYPASACRVTPLAGSSTAPA